MNEENKRALMQVREILKEELFRIAKEKRSGLDNHDDSDCGFQLLFELTKE